MASPDHLAHLTRQKHLSAIDEESPELIDMCQICQKKQDPDEMGVCFTCQTRYVLGCQFGGECKINGFYYEIGSDRYHINPFELKGVYVRRKKHKTNQYGEKISTIQTFLCPTPPKPPVRYRTRSIA